MSLFFSLFDLMGCKFFLLFPHNNFHLCVLLLLLVLFNPKRAGGGAESAPLRHFLLYLCQLLFFRTETSWLFSFKPYARFKTIFIKIGPRVMTRHCVIARWVQWKNWFSIEITHKSCFLPFLSFRIHFHYVLSYLFGLFGVRTCVSILWHTSLLKNATFAWKNSEKPWFWRFPCFWHDVTYDVTVTSYKVCFEFFWYQWTREGS